MVRARVPPTLLLLPLLLLVLVHSLFDLDPLVVIIDVDASSSFSSFSQPQEITRLSNLSTLYLFYNHRLELKKPDLEDLALSLTKLEELHLDEVDISAPFPDRISNLSSLKLVDLSESCNMLHGQITPYFFENLSTLTRLELHDNQLSGEIPSSIGNLSQLRILDLSHNQLAGSIPSSIIIS
ncbi:hypothetical protein SAY86_009200 [Trapa natans]|uniref:Uncharacterized protein n=1 Tax=Trapa natans TaxID=22666 RepID=A0AAN7L3I7_TRANT|nr:hypothetical protein SAY86_009200 [Trapa natans]